MSNQELLRRELELQFFNAATHGKLLLHFAVTKGRDVGSNLTAAAADLLRVGRRSKDESSDEDDQKSSDKKKLKRRILCIASKLDKSIVLYYLKRNKKAGNFDVIHQWMPSDLKSLEDAEDFAATINLGKPYKWTLESPAVKYDLLWNLFLVGKIFNKKPPKLINTEESKIAKRATIDLTSQLVETDVLSRENLEKAKSNANLDVDTAVPLMSVDEVLNDFQWDAGGDASALEKRLIDEIQALETANINGIIESEAASNQILEQIESALFQMDQIDEWLSHYIYLLDRMGQDVHQVEIQNKDMKIASANQKVLLSHIEQLMASLKVPGSVIEVLRNEPLEQTEGVVECVGALNKLMAVVKRNFGDMSDMQAVKERIAMYKGAANHFVRRLSEYLESYFKMQNENYAADKNRLPRKGSVKLAGQDAKEIKLFDFIPLLKWLKDLDEARHYELLLAYIIEFSKTYKREFAEYLEVIRLHQMASREMIVEKQDFLFHVATISVASAATQAIKNMKTNVQHVPGSSAVGGIKSTLQAWRPGHRKSKTADFDNQTDDGMDDDDSELRVTLGSNISLKDDSADRMLPDVIFNQIMVKIFSNIMREQNVMTDIFNFSEMDSTVVINSKTWQETLFSKREPPIDVKTEKKVNELIIRMFDGTLEKLMLVVDAGLKHDQTFAIAMLSTLELHLDDHKTSAYNLIVTYSESLYKRTLTVFEKFVEEQVKAIEETRVTVRRRKGILPFISIFPHYVERMEGFLIGDSPKTRKIVDKSYNKIIKVMFESLDAIASQVDQEPKSGSDEKEYLNVQIMTVENMHHFYSRIRARKVNCLAIHVKQAKTAYESNLDTYCKVAVRKPLGKLLEFFEGIDGLLKTRPAEEVSYHLQYSKNAVKEVIRKYPGKEIKKGLETLYKRVDKHYTVEEGLLQVVWRGIQEEFCRQFRRYEELISKCYPESSIRLDFTLEELLSYFSEIARSH